MRTPFLVTAALLAALPLAAPQATAQGAPASACKAVNATPDERIEGCTALIDGKTETGRSLAIAYCNRGFALTEKRELDRAFADLEEAIGIDPTYACSFSNRGRIWAFKGDLDRAIADYDTALKLDPNFAIAYNNRGDALMKRGDIDKAIEDFTTAIKHDPQNAHAYGNRGWAYERKRDFARALLVFVWQDEIGRHVIFVAVELISRRDVESGNARASRLCKRDGLARGGARQR